MKARFKKTFEAGINDADFEFNQTEFTGDYEPRWRNQYSHVFTTSYGIPDRLWGYGVQGGAWLPPLKG